MGMWSGFLLVPTLLGGGVNAFVFKLCVTDVTPIAVALENRNQLAFWLSVFCMFLWQYVPCVAFFCWLNCAQISSERREFATAHRLLFFERISDIYWPQSRNLLIYLFLLISAACAAEYERSALVFRASQGTGTEFFSHWLLKAYFMTARVDPLLAGKTVLFYAAVFALISIPVVGSIAWLGGQITPRLLRGLGGLHLSYLGGRTQWDRMLLPMLVGIVLLPFVPTLMRGLPLVGRVGTATCILSVFLPALAIGVVCALFSVLARLGWPKALSNFNKISLALCLGVAIAGFLPPIGLAFMGMWWLKYVPSFQESASSPVVALWWLLLCVASLPIFVPGYLATQFVVKTRELAFQHQHRASFYEVLRISFWGRLWPAYMLFGIFIYAFMWSEYPLTALFSGLSTKVCSPILDLAIRIEGKGAAYNEAAGIILQMIFPLLICVVGFGFWTKKRTSIMQTL